MVSINSALSVDLTGQVASESIGPRQFSGTGGQVDFVRGAALSKGGRSFLCLNSVAETQKGRISRIQSTLTPGSVVTTLRTDVHHIVTEYGAVDLRNRDTRERAKRLISIAHPDFRDQLENEAREQGIIH